MIGDDDGGYVVTSCSKISFVDQDGKKDQIGCCLHHGDLHHQKLTCKLIEISSDTTEKGRSIAEPWDSRGELSKTYVSNVLTSQIKSKESEAVSQSYIDRIILADNDTKNLHHSHSQKASSDFDFKAVLDAPQSGEPTEKILCQLKCKAIINTSSLGHVHRDIIGDCYVVLTENIAQINLYRRIYLVQVRSNSYESSPGSKCCSLRAGGVRVQKHRIQ